MGAYLMSMEEGPQNILQIMSNNSYQQPVNEPAATVRVGIGEKFPDANDDVAASDCRRKPKPLPG